ncbi:MAG: hypothetical protein AAGG81_01970 [Chlamydiota bacterium]
MFAVIYRGYIKPGRELDYRSAWRTIATYFVEKRGALGSCLHKTEDDLWLAYSRWPDEETRNASWPKEEDSFATELPQEIRDAVVVLKDTIHKQLPEITMEIVDDLLV